MGKRLLNAAREGQVDHVRQLVVSSGAPFTSDWLGTTALHLAAQHGHAEIAEILLRGGVNRDARTKLERTALHLAAQSGSLPVVESLLIHGSDINARDMLKMTPLHWAVDRRHIDIVRRLLVGGADVQAKSKFQLTAMEIAQNSGYYEIVELLRSWRNKIDNDLSGAFDDDEEDDDDDREEDEDDDNNDHQVNNSSNKFFESHHDIFDVNYQLMLAEPTSGASVSRGTSMLDMEEPGIDLVELEWNTLKFDVADFSHLTSHNIANDNDDTDHHHHLHLHHHPHHHHSHHQQQQQQHNHHETGNSTATGQQNKPCELEYLMKMVEELQKENEHLRKRLEQVSSASPTPPADTSPDPESPP